jgi:putative copper resistance protein D
VNLAAGMIAVRFALYVDLMLVFGLPLFALHTAQPRRKDGSAAVSAVALSVWSMLGAVLSILGLLLIAAGMSDVPLFQLDREGINGLLNGTAIGTAGKVRVAALLLAALVSFFAAASRRVRWALQSAMGAVALASLAWTGHGAADEGPRGLFHLTADIVHLLAAGVWVGALAGLLVLLAQARRVGNDRADRIALAHRALAGFATVGTVAVALIVATGLVNSWFLIGFANISSLASSLYGRLLILKLVVFAGMIGLAGLNRFKLTPAIMARGGALATDTIRSIRRSVSLEASLALIVLGLIAWLGTLAPPAMPFSH